MVSSLLSLLSLLVDRAFHTRADLPPCPVPLTGRRYGFPSGNQSPGSLRSTSLSMAPELMATSFDSGSHWPSLSPSARATLADPRFGIVSRVLRPRTRQLLQHMLMRSSSLLLSVLRPHFTATPFSVWRPPSFHPQPRST